MIKRASLLLAAALPAGCAAPPPAAAPIPRSVLVTTAKPASGADTILIGTARATDTHLVATEPGGRVVRLLVDVGDRVRAGQAMALLDPRPAQLRHQAATARLRRLEVQAAERQRHAERVHALLAAGSSTAAELDTAQSEARGARDAVAEARAEARIAARTAGMTVVRAPAAGTVTARPASLSMEAAPGAVLFELQGMREPTEIVAAIAEAIAARLSPGSAARFEAGNAKGQAVLAGVSSRGTGFGTRETRWRVVRGTLTPGSSVALQLAAQPEALALVPAEALIAGPAGTHLIRWVDPQSRVRQQQVTLQAFTAAGALVRGNIPSAARVIAAGGTFVTPGTRVRPRPLD